MPIRKYFFVTIAFICLLPNLLYSQTRNLNPSRTLFVASGSGHLIRNKDFRTTFEINYLNALYKEGNLSPKQAQKKMLEFRNLYDKYFIPPSSTSAYDYYQSFLNLGSSAASVAEKAKVSAIIELVKSTSSTTKLIYDDLTSVDPDRAKEVNYGMFNFDRVFRNDILGAAHDLADENGNYSLTFNLFFSQKVGHDIDETAEEILENDPDLARDLRIKNLTDLVNQVKDGTVSVERLATELNNVLTGAGEVAIENNKLLKEMRAARLTEDSLNLVRQYEQLKIEAAYAGVSILSNIAKVLGNERLASQISVLGNSTINIVNAITKFKDVSKTFVKSGGKFMGTLVLSATIFSAVLDIFSIFADPGPNPFEVISDQLKHISEQIDVLRNEMHERFDIVDYKLDIIYTNLIRGLSILFEQQQQIIGSLRSLKQSVDDANENIMFYGRNISNKLDNDFLSSLWTNLTKINNRSDEELSEQEFLNIRDDLYTYGVTKSKQYSQNFALDKFDESNNLTLYSLLRSSHTLNTNYNCLKDILGYKFGKNVPSNTIADLNIWLVASNALLKLAEKWPDYNINAEALTQLINTGSQIENFSRINYLYNSKSKKFEPDTTFIDTLIDSYRTNALNLISNEFKVWESEVIHSNYNDINPDTLPQNTTLFFPVTIDYPGRKQDSNDFKKIVDSFFVDKLVPERLKLLQKMGMAKTNIYIEIRFKEDSISYRQIFARWPQDHYVHLTDTFAVPTSFVLNYNTYFNTSAGYKPSKLQGQIVIPLNEKWPVGGYSTDHGAYRFLRTDLFMENFKRLYIPAILKSFNRLQFYDSDSLKQFIDSAFATEIVKAKCDILGSMLQHTVSDRTTFIRKLDFNYELVKSYAELTFPQSMSDDDSLLGFFYGKNGILSSDNYIYYVSKFKENLLDNPKEYKKLDLGNAINLACDSLKNYFIRKLIKSSNNANFEKILLLDLTIKNLKILKASVEDD